MSAGFASDISRSVTDAFEYFSTISGGFPEPYTFGRRVQQYFQSNPIL